MAKREYVCRCLRKVRVEGVVYPRGAIKVFTEKPGEHCWEILKTRNLKKKPAPAPAGVIQPPREVAMPEPETEKQVELPPAEAVLGSEIPEPVEIHEAE